MTIEGVDDVTLEDVDDAMNELINNDAAAREAVVHATSSSSSSSSSSPSSRSSPVADSLNAWRETMNELEQEKL